MDIQSALGECDIARAILIAMGAYKKTPSPNESILQSLTFAVESSLDRAKGVFSYKKNNQIQSAPTPSPCPSIEPNGVTIGDRIKIARENLGMSEDDLAEKLDIHPGDVLTWEDNADQPLAGMIIPLANALKCDLMWLLTGNPDDVKAAQPAPAPAPQPVPAPVPQPAPQPAPVNVMKDADMANIGVRIRNRRNYMGISTLKLAEEIDVSNAMIWAWEEGEAIPHSDYIDKLAKALDTSVTWLITGNTLLRKSLE